MKINNKARIIEKSGREEHGKTIACRVLGFDESKFIKAESPDYQNIADSIGIECVTAIDSDYAAEINNRYKGFVLKKDKEFKAGKRICRHEDGVSMFCDTKEIVDCIRTCMEKHIDKFQGYTKFDTNVLSVSCWLIRLSKQEFESLVSSLKPAHTTFDVYVLDYGGMQHIYRSGDGSVVEVES